jgi:hypothetical protein
MAVFWRAIRQKGDKMDAYLYRSALYCEDCAQQIKDALGYRFEGVSEYDYDSDEYPKGPFSDGGGESDTPGHCDRCGVFLENPLTSDGYTYVRQAVSEATGNPEVLREWREFYL